MQPRRVLPFDDGRSSVRIYTEQKAVSSAGPTFVLLPGLGMSHRSFRRLLAPLVEVGAVHAIDPPGFGAGPRPRRRMTVEDTAGLVASAIDDLGTGPVVVVGHSMGAQFAIELSVQRPDLVSHVVLVGPVVDPSRQSVLWHGAALALDTLRERPAVNTVVFTDYLRCGIPWYTAQLAEMMTYTIMDRIGQVGAPVLVLRGSGDPVARRPWADALASAARNGSAVSVTGGAHVIQYRRPGEVADCILRFALSRAATPESGDVVVDVDA